MSPPRASARDAIAAAVFARARGRIWITGDTISFRSTTQAPQFVLERAIADGVGAPTCILVAQPRRVAAVSIARRVAEAGAANEWETSSGIGPGRIARVRSAGVFVTTGVLLRRLAADPA